MVGNTPLHQAAFGDKLDIVKYLVDERDCDPMTRGDTGCTLLHCACVVGNLDMVKHLLDEKKVNPLSPDGLGASSLHVAAGCGHLPVLKLLIEEYLCDPDIKDRQGKTLADIAKQQGKTDISSYLSFIQDLTSCEFFSENLMQCSYNTMFYPQLSCKGSWTHN